MRWWRQSSVIVIASGVLGSKSMIARRVVSESGSGMSRSVFHRVGNVMRQGVSNVLRQLVSKVVKQHAPTIWRKVAGAPSGCSRESFRVSDSVDCVTIVPKMVRFRREGGVDDLSA
jgi:hypothetical protein